MKKIIAAAAALFITTAALQAQTTEVPKEGKATHSKKGIYPKHQPFAQLNLTEEQKKQAKDLNEGYRKQIADLKKTPGITIDEFQKKTVALRKEQKEKMQALLTTEQKNQLAAQRKEMGERIKKRPAQRIDQMKTSLGLTDEQAKQLKEGQAGVQTKIKSIREDKSLTDEQKKEQVKTVLRQQHEQLKTVLTPQQLQKMKSARKARITESR